jgi:tRNA-uridine 2-sulfurtransferase
MHNTINSACFQFGRPRAIVIPVQTVFIAMSGGIDSSYSACLLKQQGFKVVGFTFDLLPRSLKDACNPKTCCSDATVGRAKAVADALSIPHYVLNMREEFEEQVIQRFIDEYRIGRTPNPCVLCNKFVKFGSFLKKAKAMGADRVATGHYALMEETSRGFELRKGRDRAKDQSYFLYPILRGDLPFLLFPLAEYQKSEVRTAFRSRGWNLGQEKIEESQDICFIPDNNYKAFVTQFVPAKKGPIVTVDGRHLGYHQGIHLFTIGQRRGINIPHSEPLYVVTLDAGENAVVVGTKADLSRTSLTADEVNFLVPFSEGTAAAKIRYRQKEQACSYSIEDGAMSIRFSDPVSSVTPGQSVVLYEGETVLGGGTIR